MNIVFLTLPYLVDGHNIYTDLCEEFVREGNVVTVCMADEKRTFGSISFSMCRGVKIISIPTGKIRQTNKITKGINTILLEYRFLNKLSKINFSSIDVLFYSTPPITFLKVSRTLKKKYKCINYLLLKDIFPQNAVDVGIIKENGIIYKYFRNKEKQFYSCSDIIGCMSPANKKFLLTHNPELGDIKVNITPNAILPRDVYKNSNKSEVLNKYEIPVNTINLIYGGNLGLVQGVDFIIQCIGAIKNYRELFLTIAGSGTEYAKLEKYLYDNNIPNVKLIPSLPVQEYWELLSCMDAGLIFLDYRFTIPNFPSRLLDYLNYSLPVIACTDIVCDIKEQVCDKGVGFWCGSNDIDGFQMILEKIIKNKELLVPMREKSHEILMDEYSVQKVVPDILSSVKQYERTGR